MATPPVFPTKLEALAILDEELARVNASQRPSFAIEKQKCPGSQRLTWWHDVGSENECSEAALALACLRTYVRLTGGRPLPAGGLKLRKDRVWMDRLVVSTLESEGMLSFAPTGHFEPCFVITDKGRRWIETGKSAT